MSLSNSGLHLPDLPENFDLSDVRTEIDSIDKQILDLFVHCKKLIHSFNAKGITACTFTAFLIP